MYGLDEPSNAIRSKAGSPGEQAQNQYQLVEMLKTIDAAHGFEQEVYRILSLDLDSSETSRNAATIKISELVNRVSKIEGELACFSHSRDSLIEEIAKLKDELARMHASESWRFGWLVFYPLRWMRASITGLRRMQSK